MKRSFSIMKLISEIYKNMNITWYIIIYNGENTVFFNYIMKYFMDTYEH